MVPVTDFAEVNGTSLYYELAGTGHPLVLIHGSPLDTRMWIEQVEVFAQQYQVICYDVRGYGRSAPPVGNEYTHADDLRALLTYLGVAHAHVVGLSMGGAVALDFALTYPAIACALVLVDSALSGFSWSPQTFESLNDPQSSVEERKQLFLEHPLFAPAREHPQVTSRLKQMIFDYSAWHWANHDPERPLEPSAIQRLHTIMAPVLIAVGERDLQAFHLIADLLQYAIPDTEKVVLPGIGHMTNMEDPNTFNQIVLNFLSKRGMSRCNHSKE